MTARSHGSAYEVIVVGLGGMDSAAAYHLARRGPRVLGLERFTSAHDQGSSHGGSRLISQAYFEDPAERARELLSQSLSTARQLGLGKVEQDAVALLA